MAGDRSDRTQAPVDGRFEIGDADFLLDGRPFRVLSGTLHYFRIHPEHWADRIAKARQLGLNTIDVYVPWNAHEPRPGEYTFDGGLDLEAFLDEIAAQGLHAIVRPGPYICAEWAGGGLPAWLTERPDVRIRSSDPAYLEPARRWFETLLPRLATRQITRGGPIIMVKVENEYGAYGDDQSYLKSLAVILEGAGIEVPLFTCDQPDDRMLARGGLPGLLRTATFGSRSAERLATLRRHQPTGPLMCAEFWNGWFDHWGTPHHTTSAATQASELAALLAAGASVNLYVLHGGTNFGFTNGANDKGIYQPTVTSYDYDAPLSEDGSPTAKYWAFREVIGRHVTLPEQRPGERRPAPVPLLQITSSVPLTAVEADLGTVAETDRPPTMDALAQYEGFARYTVRLPARTGPAVLAVTEIRDRAVVELDGTQLGVLSREHRENALPVPPGGPAELSLLVEDQGRVTYGPRIGEPKGIIGRVRLDGAELRNWRTRPLALDPDRIRPAARPTLRPAVAGPAFVFATFDLDGPADLFLDTDGWTKGVAWINGFCLGRYWSRGPQGTLFVPGPVTRAGANELMLFELHAGVPGRLAFRDGPDLGPTEF